jgi:hypothetical protein
MKDQFTDDFTPQEATRKLRESDIQKRCVAYARANGWWARKFSSPSQRSVPDYLFATIASNGHPLKVAVEFKAPGKTSTDAQREEQRLMRAAGWIVWSDVGFGGERDIAEFKRRLDALAN